MRKNKIQTQKGKKHGHQKWESDKETRGLGPGWGYAICWGKPNKVPWEVV